MVLVYNKNHIFLQKLKKYLDKFILIVYNKIYGNRVVRKGVIILMLISDQLHQWLYTMSMEAIDLDTFASGANECAYSWGGTILIIIGIALIIAGVYKIAKGLMSGGRAQVNWLVCLLCLAIGGALVFSQLAYDIGNGANATLYDMGSGQAGTIVMDVNDIGSSVSDIINT